jgi:tetratricopeptide (TPR) repeat protein
MKSTIRAASRRLCSSSVDVLSVVIAIALCTAAPPRIGGATTIRFVNGREIEVTDYWRHDRRVMFEYRRGTVGVPAEFVAAIGGEPAADRNIGGRDGGVNAPRLSPEKRSVTLASMSRKDELYDRAVDFVAEGNLPDAIQSYREALALDPSFTDALHGLAMAYADQGMFDEAIEHGKRLVELTPDDTLAHTSLSMFYQRKGMIAEAEAEGAKARVLDWKRQLDEQKEADKKDGGS